MLKEGIVLGDRYEVISRIGSGGMADVYKARDHKLSRLVAVKVMKAEFREDTSFVAKFQKEAQAAARLSHPNVVNVFDVGEDRGLYYIVMELVEGITLKNYITKKGKLSVKEATSIAIQVSLGLQAAHNQGIIHRDVKPQNIIISTDGKVKLSDFGIAKATNSNTITANVMGSVHYSSPEQVRGGVSDARSDIYSLGITMYEMVTGRVPFDGDTTVSIAIKHLQEEIVPPSRYTPDLPHALEQIILKCTQKNQNRRYQNVGELIEDLKRSLLDPQGDFVTMTPISADGQTVRVSDGEMKEIRNGISGKNNQRSGEDKIRRYSDEPDEEEDNKKSSKLEKGLTIGGFIIGAIIIVILIFVLGNMFGIFSTNKNSSSSASTASTSSSAAADTVEVPDFTGMTVDEATAEANKLGIGVRKKSTESSDTYDEGEIIAQDPAAGTSVEKATTIYLTVSSGKATVTVPSGLVGSSQSDAESALTGAGLVPTVELQTDNDVAVGNVISVDPEEGTEVESGATVKLYVSKGGNTVSVPDLRGYDEDTAKTSLSNLGLKYEVTTGSSDSYGEGEVIKMSPAPGQKVAAGTTITLTVNGSDSSDSSNSDTSGTTTSGKYICRKTFAEPSDYNGGSVRMELIQDGKTTVIYDGDNPWANGDYSEPIESTSGSTGTIYIYENGVRKWQYSNVEFEAE
jgi:serine/threonine protein kinase